MGKGKGRPRPPPKRSREFLLSPGSSNRRTVPGREHGSRHPPPLFDTFPRRSRFARRDLDVRRSPEAGRKRFSPLPPPRSRNIEIFAPTIEIFASRIDYVEPPPCVPPFVKSVKKKRRAPRTCAASRALRGGWSALARPSRSVEGAGRRRKGPVAKQKEHARRKASPTSWPSTGRKISAGTTSTSPEAKEKRRAP
eukprot:scaffold2636_cov340-Pavlova_lutheri.AAC.96